MAIERKILVLGGTEFVGRQLVERLLQDEVNDVYLFNRGKTNAHLFPEAKKILGDRETNDIEKLAQHQWDYVFDFSSYFPGSLKRTLQNINQNVKKYVYISTISVYAFDSLEPDTVIAEDYKKKVYEDDQLTEPSLKFYGEKKVACEDVLKNTPWLNAIVLRPSVIFGKFDPTERLYYWIDRIRNQERIILPDNGDCILSMTYAADMVEVLHNCIASEFPNGTYNIVSNDQNKLRETLNIIKEELGVSCHFEPIGAGKLKAEGLSAKEFPFWWGVNLRIDNAKLRKTEMFVPVDLKSAIKETLKHYESLEWPKPKIGLAYEVENGLIEKWEGDS